ncbi:hypothetical protein D9M71_529910 [compost metagenome]
MIGKRPMNSGIRPNSCRSSGSSEASSSLIDGCAWRGGWAWKPMPPVFGWMRLQTSASRPGKAPPAMNRMLRVSTTCSSPCSLRRPDLAMRTSVPSTIFSRACCTPSPEMSRTAVPPPLRRASLSTSSM